MNWQGKNKAITFSFDDGVKQDIRLVEIFNKYGLKCTFNINSALLGLPNRLVRNEHDIDHSKIDASQVKSLYQGHEVAVHTLTHPNLKNINTETVIRQVEEDRKALSALCGYDVLGMAYPGGSHCVDERVVQAIRENTPIRYARTTTSSHSFDLPTGDLLMLNPTVYYIEDCLEDMVDEFLSLKADKPQMLYIWGHSYEMDAEYISWEKFERICKKLSGKEDIFYGTNMEVLF